MAFNLVDLVKDQIGEQVVKQLGGALGGSSDVTEKAVSGAIPSILEGLMSKASTEGGAESVFKAVQEQDDGILSNLGDLIGGGIDSPFASVGFSVLRSLLGNSMLGNIAGAIGGFSGLGRSKSSSMLGLVAPIIMSVIKRKVLGGGLNASSLASMLTGQKDNISAALPAGFADQIRSTDLIDDVADTVKGGVGTVSKAASTAAGTVGGAAADTVEAGGSLLGKLLPILLLGAAAIIGWNMFGGSKTATTEDVVVQTAPAESTAVVEEAVAIPASAVVAPGGVAGSYTITQTTPMGDIESVVTINADGTGTVVGMMGEAQFSGATIDGDNIAFDMKSNTPNGLMDMTYSGIVSGDTINGIVSSAMGETEFAGSRNK